ncbi:2-C-methyl-D-erythritol 4-phosphate cytidylyltransferase [Candidatus Pantoea edessiphila]|uniref:2-C-methyl-D-erythritol 4-phosphate cytidylyltransferase n=1 Tax=Candidatus Pantoea edessiphila TaxID=2044610 RepID=A0A2P5SXM5_9GAMM|nr:2-C-methyl-D-erythritol 4-phosphate cytidylyltransferase [Candidatus Pantoea edessiphila]MBK4775678.1 2-C-methyl-D-erythritol 4-phosphate cytidylyltransferase [Pantoea sp. Edef]PPI87091.1 2-C-methyl-D-erythritol 4-phosphate cytidylyltransferase [Candidatus Pantoea edessiphila]
MNSLCIKQNIVAIVPAAGIGKRMKISIPKQYLIVGKQTIIEHCISNLLSNSYIKHIIVALNVNDRYFSKLPIAHDNRITCVTGGATRAQSVLSALKAVYNSNWVIIHDASRPCLHKEDLNRLIKIREKSNIGGILAVPVIDTIKISNNRKTIIKKTVERDNLWRAMTPQFFYYPLIVSCMTVVIQKGINITDESSALELCGYYPILIQGRNDNIKVTYPEDLLLTEIYLNKSG